MGKRKLVNRYPKLLLFLGAILLFIFPSMGQQTDTLSLNSEIFYQQIESMLMETPSKTYQKKSEELLERFYARWSVGRFNKVEKDAVRQVVGDMRDRGMRAYPYLFDYIGVLTLLSESTQVPRSIIAWHAYADTLLLDKSTKPFDDFLEFTKGLLEDNLLYSKRSLDWIGRNARFKFDLDTTFVLRVEKTDLVCRSKRDSSVIEKTAGIFFYKSKLWHGESGEFNWGRFGEEWGKAITATFPAYQIDMNEPEYAVDSVTLTYPRFLERPMLGSFSDRVMASSPNTQSQVPFFRAYEEENDLDQVYPGIDFQGGVEVEGMHMYGTGTEALPALVSVKREERVLARLHGQRFMINDGDAISAHASCVVYLDQDSIYHPGLRVKYDNAKEELILYNVEDGNSSIPFFDSYHQLDIYVQALFWDVREDSLIFKKIRAVKGKNKAYFVSSNYFSDREFYHLQGIDEIHPLYVIRNFLNTYKVDEIQLNVLADYMQMSAEQVSAMLINLANRGFLVYNTSTQIAMPKDRLFYFLEAKSGTTDYDVIYLESDVITRPNASLNMNDLGLSVYGVPEVSISDSQEVYIYPYDRYIRFFKNRNFTFNGHVHMGLLDFYARNSTFVYDSFLLRMNYVDSLTFMVNAKDSTQVMDSLVRVANAITDLNGTIYIDDPNNKSGLKDYPEFPSFTSNDESYVYFNKASIQDSTLVPDRFFYRVDPFVFDSIRSFTTEGLAFKGTLVSAGVFPDIEEPLVVASDYSLGLRHKTPANGYPVYDGKGNFTDNITLSNAGFLGNGRLDYLSATTRSDYFIFYPDSLIAEGQGFTVKADNEVYDFPSVQGDTVDLRWLIDTNVLYVDNREKPFIMYQNSWLEGPLRLEPKALTGAGSFFFDQSQLDARNIHFGYDYLNADTADFYLKNREIDTLVFKANQYEAHIDFAEQTGYFVHRNGESYLEFPFNQYIATLDEVHWLMEKDELRLHSQLTANKTDWKSLTEKALITRPWGGAEFISIRPDQDSLRYFAGAATYDLADYHIAIDSVPFIHVADGAVIPGDGGVVIERNAQMSLLNNAVIIADTAHLYHKIYDARVQVNGRNDLTATGWMNYVDRLGAQQPVLMDEIRVDSTGTIYGNGTIPEGELFFLGPEYFYKGTIGFRSKDPYLDFEGGYRLNQECVLNYDDWVGFDGNLNPKHISFAIKDSTFGQDGRQIHFGLGYDQSFHRYYPLVMQPLKDEEEIMLIDARGNLTFDTLDNSFVVGHRLASNPKAPFAGVRLMTSRCIMEGRGALDLGLDLDQVNTSFTGRVEHVIPNDSTRLQGVLTFDFFLDDHLPDIIIDSLRMSYNEGVVDTKGLFGQFLWENMGADAEPLISELGLYGQIRKIPDILKQRLIFTDVNLYWDSYTRSWYSKGRIGLGYLNGETINKYMDGIIQLTPGSAGSSFTIYLEPSPGSWYFITYKAGIMQLMSSDAAFNDKLETMKEEKRVINADDELHYYEFVISTKRKVVDFKRRMESEGR